MTTATTKAGDELERVNISFEQLKNNFIISMKEYIKQTSPPVPSEEKADNAGDQSDENDHNNEDALDNEDVVDLTANGLENNNEENDGSKKKKKSKKMKAPKVEDYDVEDPFIDDSEVTAVYESVFDLMMAGGNDASNEQHSDRGEDGLLDLPEREHSTETRKRRLTPNDFYVFRGPIEVEVVEKEFDAPKKKKKKKKTTKGVSRKNSEDAIETSQLEEDKPNKKKRSRKTSSNLDSVDESQSSNKRKKAETISLTERLQQLEAEIEEREGKANDDVAMNDEPEEDSKANIRKFYDIDKVLDAFAKFKECIDKVSQFDPLKFPTMLRAPLERYIVACLKRDADILDESVLEEVAGLIPYSAQSLRKLLLKKIFPLLIESHGQVRPEIIRARIREDIALTLSSEESEPPTDGQSKPPKGKKRRWSEMLKQLVFEYLKCASEQSVLLRAIRLNVEDPTTKPLPSSLSETALRRSAYRELVGCWPEDKWPMTSAELSRECSAYKKKYERGLLREHNVDIEQFLVIVEKPDKAAAGEQERNPAANEVIVLKDTQEADQAGLAEAATPAANQESSQIIDVVETK